MKGSSLRPSLSERVVSDQAHPCVYLPNETARLPLRYPSRKLTRAEFDARMAAGDRRSGIFLYRTQCPACSACEPIRLDLEKFAFTASHRRTLRKGDEALQLQIGPPKADLVRADLYTRHKRGRGLVVDESDRATTPFDYASFLVESCCETIEFSYWDGEQLMSVAIADRGEQSLNAVYCCFDPEYARLSPGTYSILKQVEFCRREGIRYLYLGLYIGQCTHMNYKAKYLPHERRIKGVWQAFE